MNDERLATNTIEMRVLMSLLWKSISQSLDQWLLEHEIDLTRLQLSVLRVLSHEGSHTLSDLSRKFGVDPSTLVPTADALERKGWVSRGRDPKDRRRFPLTLTAEGETVLKNIPIIHVDDPLLNALQQTDPAAVEQMLEGLLALVLHLPDGKDLLKTAESRLFAHGAKEEYLVCKPHKTT
jgi:DNA-binding MarR family transcriptional regulator